MNLPLIDYGHDENPTHADSVVPTHGEAQLCRVIMQKFATEIMRYMKA